MNKLKLMLLAGTLLGTLNCGKKLEESRCDEHPYKIVGLADINQDGSIDRICQREGWIYCQLGKDNDYEIGIHFLDAIPRGHKYKFTIEDLDHNGWPDIRVITAVGGGMYRSLSLIEYTKYNYKGIFSKWEEKYY